MSASEDEETQDYGTVYMYRIPFENDGGVKTPAYDASPKGGLYMQHYGINYMYVIQGKAAGHFHRDEVNVSVTELDEEEVEKSDNLIEDFV